MSFTVLFKYFGGGEVEFSLSPPVSPTEQGVPLAGSAMVTAKSSKRVSSVCMLCIKCMQKVTCLEC